MMNTQASYGAQYLQLRNMVLDPRDYIARSVGFCRWLGCFASLAVAFDCQAQETPRVSLAGEQAAETRHLAATGTDGYNLKLGPTAWIFTTSLALEASDNIRLEHTNPQADLIFRPEAGTQMNFPVSEKNTLKLAAVAGYSAYLRHSEYDRWYVTPGSELSFDVYMGDVWLNVHDRFSILQDAYQDPTVVGIADFSQLRNAAGLAAVCDLNKAFLKASYDHVNYLALRGVNTGSAHQPDGSSDVLSSSIGLHLGRGLSTGLEGGATFIRYAHETTAPFFADGTQGNVGAFFEDQISECISAKGNLGYTVFSPQPNQPEHASAEFSGLFATLAMAHRVNRFLDYELSGGRNLNFSLYGGTVDLTSARLVANWRLFWKTQLSTSFGFEHGAQLGSEAEVFNRYGPSMRLERAIMKELTANITYQFYYRDSDLLDRDYSVNIAILQLEYRF